MEESNEYEDAMNLQGRKINTRATSPQNVETTRPSTQKNLGSLFGPKSNLYTVSSLCSRLNAHLLEGNKLDLSAPRTSLLDAVQALEDVGQLPNDEIMEDLLVETEAINNEDKDFR